ncbi:MAG: Rieske 2Fe-2S domain-containing protein [Anaerolineae bacterium]|nr:Rieske 2Fe-2S domain-containing protein [Anaerolineae bacterium]
MNRRKFLTLAARGSLAAAAVAAASQVVRFLAFQPPDPTPTTLPVGQPGSYPRGSLIYVAEARVYIGHDRRGLYAVDAVCPHLGCLVELAEKGGFVCPCHDSRFDAEGQVVTGPATRPLSYLRLWLDQEQGQLMVDRGEPVEPSARLTL